MPAERRPDANPSRPSLAAAPVVALKDGELRVALSKGGAVSGLPSMDPALRDAIAEALRGALPAPQGLEPLQSGPLTLLGAPAGVSPFAPAVPLGTRVANDRPVFRWSPHPDARRYEVSVFDQDLQKRAGSGPITVTEWTPERPLPRGRTYLWQVSALTGHGRVRHGPGSSGPGSTLRGRGSRRACGGGPSPRRRARLSSAGHGGFHPGGPARRCRRGAPGAGRRQPRLGGGGAPVRSPTQAPG